MDELNKSILIVENEFLIASALRMQVEDIGLQVCAIAATVDAAIALAQEHRPMLVLMDVRLGEDRDGVDAASAIHETVGSKTIFLTGSSEPANLKRMIEAGYASAVLFKPLSNPQLRSAIEAAIDG